MAKIRSPHEVEIIRDKVTHAAAVLFLEKGFNSTTVKDISRLSKVPESAIYYELKSKDEILSDIIKYVIKEQFRKTEQILKDKPHDGILFYATETTLQLHMAESSELVRGLYAAAYSLPKTTEIIQHTITGKLELMFKEHLPHLETKDFYELEIATGGIMRGFLSVPCDMYFTMDRKVRRFLETSFMIYSVPMEKINAAIDFVSQIDFDPIAKQTIDDILFALSRQAE